MTKTPDVPLITQFCRVWTESFTNVLGPSGVVSPVVTATDPAPAKALSSEELGATISVSFKGGGILKGVQVWLAEKPAALQLAQLLMAETLDPAAEFSDTHRDAFAELLRQVAGQAATAWKLIAGGETEIVFQAASDAAFVPAQSITVKVSGEKFAELSLRFLVNSALFDALAVAVPTPEAPQDPEAQEVPPPPTQDALVGAVPLNLELLLDVELEATIRFGEKEMLLRDVLGLMPGAVIELNQLVNEPASLLVAGRLIARGEVVVVDGNFGLRVTEVTSRGQRAELLHL